MAGGDEAALTELYDRHRTAVYSLAMKVLGSLADAEDVLVDVFWQAWRQADRYTRDRGSVLTWVMTIARSRAIDRLRSSRRETVKQSKLAEHPSAGETVSDGKEHIFVTELRGQVRAALEALKPGQRKAIELAYYGGMSQSEIAASLNQPLGTVKTRMRTGMAHLREALSGYL